MKETPNKMISGMVGAMAQQSGAIDPVTGMPVNQMQQSPVNPTALGGLQSQIPNIVGQPNPTQSFNNTMPQNK